MRLKKPSFVLVTVFIIRLLSSCTQSGPEPNELNYNSLLISGIDNSGEFMLDYEDVDSMYADALAFQLVLRDTFYNEDYWYAFNPKSIGFVTAQAYSPVIYYEPQVKVKSIRVVTLLNLNDFYKAGADISDSVLFDKGERFALYYTINEIVPFFNGMQPYASTIVNAMLKIPVENHLAQFRFEVELEDARILTANTEVITIKTLPQ